MKVDLVNIRYPSAQKPQIATYIRSMEICLEKAGFEVKVVHGGRNWTSTLGKAIDQLLFNLELLLKLKGGDVLYVHHVPYILFPVQLLAKRYKRIFVHWHGDDLLKTSGFWGESRKRALDPKQGFQHIVPSHYFAKRWSEQSGRPENEVLVIPSGGVDTDLFSPGSPSLKHDEVILGFASGLVEEKGLAELQNLIDQAPVIEEKIGCPVRFAIIDYGREREAFKKSNVDKRIEIRPTLPKEKMFEFYRDIDILLFLSKRESESLGLVSLEAMACNVPVLGPDRFAVPEYVKQGNSGRLFTTDPIEPLIELISERRDLHPRKMVLEGYSMDPVTDLYKKHFR